jgi:hypothetical protein
MPNETKAYPSGMPIPEAEYYEMAPEVHVGSWSPSPPGTPPSQYVKPIQVHMRIGTPPGRVGLVRFKGSGTLDEIIDALYMHRVDVFGPRSVLMRTMLDQVRADALEEAATTAEVFMHNVPAEGGDDLDHVGRYSNGTVRRIAAAVRALKTSRDPVIKSKAAR